MPQTGQWQQSESESDDMKIQVWPLALNETIEWNLIEFTSTVKCEKNGSKKLYMLFLIQNKNQTTTYFKQTYALITIIKRNHD